MTTELQEKIELVKQFVEESSGATYKEIADLIDTTVKNVTNNIIPRHILTDDRFIKRREGPVCRVYAKEKFKNSEGYSDPTAAIAIKGDTTMEKSQTPDDLMPGMTIWINKELFLIYRVFSDAIVGWKIWAKGKSVEQSVDSQSAQTWVKDDIEFTVYTHMVMSLKRPANTPFTLAGPAYKCSYENFRAIISKFGGTTVQVSVSPEAKTPVTPVVYTSTPIADKDLALAKQAAEIWERAFMAMAGK